MVLCESHFLAAAGVTRMGGNRASGFRRAAVFRRAIARDPSPQGEGSAQEKDQNWTVSTKCVGSNESDFWAFAQPRDSWSGAGFTRCHARTRFSRSHTSSIRCNVAVGLSGAVSVRVVPCPIRRIETVNVTLFAAEPEPQNDTGQRGPLPDIPSERDVFSKTRHPDGVVDDQNKV